MSSKPVVPIWYRDLRSWEKTSLVVGEVLAFGFLIWVAVFGLNWQRHPYVSFFILATEILLSLAVVILLPLTWRTRIRKIPSPPKDLSVDVFITTLDEDVALLRTTLIRCLAMEYPHKTFILDDGNRPEIAQLAKSYGVGYFARGERSDAKAGNLNYALKRTHSDFIATFDADGIPHSSFLTKLLGYFEDPQIAIVQCHQTFYNFDGFPYSPALEKSRFWNEQSIFYDIILPARDSVNAAMWCGNGAILRRSAIDEIGGVSTGTVTEDLHTSLLLRAKGYVSAYHPEPLCYCLMPRDYRSFIIQRSRWQIGVFQTLRREWRLLLTGDKLDFWQKLVFFTGLNYYIDAFPRVASYAIPFLVLLTGGEVFVGGLAIAIAFTCFWLHRGLFFHVISRGRGAEIRVAAFRYIKVWHYVWNMIRTRFGARRATFRVTPKNAAASNSKTAWSPMLGIVSFGFCAVASIFGLWGVDGINNGGLLIAAVLSFYNFNVSREARLICRRGPWFSDSYGMLAPINLVISGNSGDHPAIANVVSEREVKILGPIAYRLGESANLEFRFGENSFNVRGRVSYSRGQINTRPLAYFEANFVVHRLSRRDRDWLSEYIFQEALPDLLKRYSVPLGASTVKTSVPSFQKAAAFFHDARGLTRASETNRKNKLRKIK